MAKLIYTINTSLDGYTTDAEGTLNWSAPTEELLVFFNDLERSIGTALYGRRMYETMAYWNTPAAIEGQPAVLQEYAQVWRAQQRIVFSRTLGEATAPRSRIEREFSPEIVRRLKAESSRDLSVGGPTLAAQALFAGLVDEIRLVVAPVVLGGGTRALPAGLRLGLQLLAERQIASGVVLLHYRVA